MIRGIDGFLISFISVMDIDDIDEPFDKSVEDQGIMGSIGYSRNPACKYFSVERPYDGPIKSSKTVTPAKTGVQNYLK